MDGLVSLMSLAFNLPSVTLEGLELFSQACAVPALSLAGREESIIIAAEQYIRHHQQN